MEARHVLPLVAVWSLALIPLLPGPQAHADGGVTLDCSWTEGFSVAGLDGNVTALASRTLPDGIEIIAGGRFLTADGQPAHHVARWTDDGWSVLAGPDGIGLDGLVTDLVFWDDGTGSDLYAAGDFETAGGKTVHHVARWTGTEWLALGSPPGFDGEDASVSDLAVFDGGGGSALYAAGDLGDLGRLARWSGVIWEPVDGTDGVSPIGTIALTVGDDTAGEDGSGPGLFALQSFGSVWKFDGQHWQEVAPAPNRPESRLTALAVWDDGDGPKIYVSGSSTTSETASQGFVRQWDGSQWIDVLSYSTLYPDQADVRTLLPATVDGDSRLFAGGRFLQDTVGGPRLANVASWDGTAWHPLGSGDDAGSNRPVSSLATLQADTGPSLLVGGEFTQAGGRSARRVATWDGSKWHPVGETVGGGAGLDGAAYAFVRWDDGSGEAIYAAGDFVAAGDRQVHHLARWDGSSWEPLEGPGGNGTDGWVSALAVFDDGTGPALYAGGFFEAAGGVAASNVARWDGQGWSAVGGGVSTDTGPLPAWVQALTVWNDGTGDALYAAGFFHHAGDAEAYSVARWDGSHWSSLGPPGPISSGVVYALEAWDDGHGPALFAAGSFLGLAGNGVSVRNAARWNGQEWQAMEDDTANFFFGLNSLAVWDDGGGPSLFAAGGIGDIFRWDGTTWTSAGTPGLPPHLELSTLEPWQGRLYVSGTDVRAEPETGHRMFFRDAGQWREVAAGHPSGTVDVLQAIETEGGSSLWAGGSFSRLGSVTSAGLGELRCSSIDETQRLRLGADRFVAEVAWRDFEGNEGVGRVVPFQTDDSGLFYFFGEDNWEMLVKVLDACSYNDRFWVFSAATTNVEYTLTVTDTATSESRTYFNPLGVAAPAVTDTGAFATCGESAADASPAAPPSPKSPREEGLQKATRQEGSGTAAKGSCTPSETVLCLEDGRFALQVDWRDFDGHRGPGDVVQGTPSDDSGLFQFFGEDNWEVLVKVLDACSYNDRFWVFSAATTNVEYTLHVTDTATGESVSYFNPLGNAADAVTDTDAFATCP